MFHTSAYHDFDAHLASAAAKVKRIKYAFERGELTPEAIADHSDYAARALSLAFKLTPAAVEVSCVARLPGAEPHRLSVYVTDRDTDQCAMILAAKLVLPNLAAVRAAGAAWASAEARSLADYMRTRAEGRLKRSTRGRLMPYLMAG